ncbi:hypothetical protein [Saccharospirillum alexandrii]|uniref:hypothetical protein n=1 Tax=Saccharospirillum alexandrii TaxID=2448477 RepID=UPI000FDA972C|nr:hypothetical protein [Saccharospirillum alexandrii]
MEFLLQEKLMVPFLATLGASLSVIAIQALVRFEKEQKQRLFTANYMLDVAYRILYSTIIVKKHTIIPHIQATKRIMGGDSELLQTTLLADEFDILKAKSMQFNNLPSDYKLLLGYDDIEIIQAFDMLIYLHEEDTNRSHLIDFVKENLKSRDGFLAKDEGAQADILNTYWDILSSLDHEAARLMVFVRDMLLPRLERYISGKQFMLFKTSDAKRLRNRINAVIEEYADLFPDSAYMEEVRDGGIQGAL